MSAPAGNQRTAEVVTALTEVLERFVYQYEVTETELWNVLDFARRVVGAGQLEALCDALGLSTAADNVTHSVSSRRTESNIPGPFYRPNAPYIASPHRVAREDEPGTPLFFRGTITSCEDDSPVGGALLDVWQANAAGVYDIQDESIPDFNLRCRFHAGDDGRFELRTVVPGPYEIPHDGPVGQLLAVVGRHAFRPRHVHFTVTREGFEPLTTQIYFPGDEFLESDSIGAAKPELVADVREVQPGETEAEERGLDEPFAVADFHFRLQPAA